MAAVRPVNKGVGQGRPHLAGTGRDGPGICILTETYHPVVGGGETQARVLADGLTARGWSVTVVTRRSDPSSPRRERRSGVEICRVPPIGHSHLKKWALLLTTVPTLVRRRSSYDLILVSGFRILGIPALTLGLLLRKPCVLKADSLGEMSGEYFTAGLAKLHLTRSFPPFRLFVWLRNRLLRRAERFVAVSSRIESELTTAAVDAAAIERIPNCVDTALFRPVAPDEKLRLRQRLGLPADRRIVIFTGRLVSYKGLPLLMAVWRELRPSHPDTLLLLVGGGGMDIHNCEDELRGYVREHSLGESVHFCGEVGNVHEYLQAADLFVFPTENEAFGISLIEAMACGLPAVSTTVGGVADVLQHEENGLAVDAGDPRQLRRALHRLLSDIELAVRLGASARKIALDGYSVDRVVELYARLAERLLRAADQRGARA